MKSADLGSISPELINFFPSQAFAHLPRDVFQSFTNEQLQHLNIEQIKMIPDNLFNSLNKNQVAIINRMRYPFKSTGLSHPHFPRIVFLEKFTRHQFDH